MWRTLSVSGLIAYNVSEIAEGRLKLTGTVNGKVD